MNLTNMITLREYAMLNNRNFNTIKASYRNGRFKTAKKIGNQIFIDASEPIIDRRKNRAKK